MQIIAKKGCYSAIQGSAKSTGDSYYKISKGVKSKDGEWKNSDIYVWSSDVENLRRVVNELADYLASEDKRLAQISLDNRLPSNNNVSEETPF